ncbi:MAG: Rieske 2Fe-2S domain-containing protein [Alphaproteobacteria bacterium]|nr:Rieske 2Fe-2S domain-containing protein [Alphaproteobacteria bacterium]
MSDWKRVCAIDDLVDKDLKEFEIDGTKIVVTRSGDDVFVYPLRCPHMDEPLSTGMCDGATVTCSFHLWQWDLRTGQSTGEAEIDLLIYPTKTEDGALFVDVSKVLSYD